MLIVSGGRQTGKTRNSILLAASTGSILLVPNAKMASCIKHQAKEMGYGDKVRILTGSQFFMEFGQTYRYHNTKDTVIIDELDRTLREMFGLNVIMATTDGAKIEVINSIKAAIKVDHEDWSECSSCHGSVGQSGKYCKHCGAKFMEVQNNE